MTFDEWVKVGFDNGWVGAPICETHDGLPTTASEDEEFEEGDPCVNIMRVYESTDVMTDVEANHSPSVWRASNAGMHREEPKA